MKHTRDTLRVPLFDRLSAQLLVLPDQPEGQDARSLEAITRLNALRVKAASALRIPALKTPKKAA